MINDNKTMEPTPTPSTDKPNNHDWHNWSNHRHHALHWIIGIAILIFVFCMGVKVGWFLGAFGGHNMSHRYFDDNYRYMRDYPPMMYGTTQVLPPANPTQPAPAPAPLPQ